MESEHHSLVLLPQGVSGAIKNGLAMSLSKNLEGWWLSLLNMPSLPAPVDYRSKPLFMLPVSICSGCHHSIRDSVNAMVLASERGYRSVAFGLIGTGTGGAKADEVIDFVQDELSRIEFDGEVRIVKFHK